MIDRHTITEKSEVCWRAGGNAHFGTLVSLSPVRAVAANGLPWEFASVDALHPAACPSCHRNRRISPFRWCVACESDADRRSEATRDMLLERQRAREEEES